MGFSLEEYKAAYKAAFGPENKRRVLLKAAQDESLGHDALIKLRAWVDRLEGKTRPAPPVAEEAGRGFPQRSENRRTSESPNGFPGTARWKP